MNTDTSIDPAVHWLPSGLDGLRREADDEAIRIVATVNDRWVDGTQRYDQPGESSGSVASPGARTSMEPCACGVSTCDRPRVAKGSHASSRCG